MSKNFYLEDILSQDAELDAVLSYCKTAEVKEKLVRISALNVKKMIFSGMGSSHFCACGANILLSRHGIDSKVISTGELIYYERNILNHDTVLCLISQSGESAEIIHLLQLLADDVFVIAVTNQAESTLGKRGDITFLMNVSDEISVTTRTYQSSLILTELIAVAACGEDTGKALKEYERTVSAMSGYLKGYENEMERLIHFCEEMEVVSLAGRGHALSSVRSGALFLREVAKFPAIDFDSAEFRHGPMEMVQEGFYAIVFAASGNTQGLNIKLAMDIAEKGGRVVLITDEEGEGMLSVDSRNILPVILPKTEEYASQLLQVIPVQLLANALAEKKEIPVGVFRWGAKITAAE